MKKIPILNGHIPQTVKNAIGVFSVPLFMAVSGCDLKNDTSNNSSVSFDQTEQTLAQDNNTTNELTELQQCSIEKTPEQKDIINYIKMNFDKAESELSIKLPITDSMICEYVSMNLPKIAGKLHYEMTNYTKREVLLKHLMLDNGYCMVSDYGGVILYVIKEKYKKKVIFSDEFIKKFPELKGGKDFEIHEFDLVSKQNGYLNIEGTFITGKPDILLVNSGSAINVGRILANEASSAICDTYFAPYISDMEIVATTKGSAQVEPRPLYPKHYYEMLSDYSSGMDIVWLKNALCYTTIAIAEGKNGIQSKRLDNYILIASQLSRWSDQMIAQIPQVHNGFENLLYFVKKNNGGNNPECFEKAIELRDIMLSLLTQKQIEEILVTMKSFASEAFDKLDSIRTAKIEILKKDGKLK